jgi:C_GCAxxG_C_C family probable redox protein
MESSLANPPDIAVTFFRQNFNCAQSVLAAFAPQLGFDENLALQLASPFGGGMARTGKTCGAVTGGLIVLGLKFGYTSPEGRDATYKIVQEFMQRFEEQHGSLSCRELLGFDVSTPESRDRAQQSGVFQNICPGLVRDAAEILQSILS